MCILRHASGLVVFVDLFITPEIILIVVLCHVRVILPSPVGVLSKLVVSVVDNRIVWLDVGITVRSCQTLYVEGQRIYGCEEIPILVVRRVLIPVNGAYIDVIRCVVARDVYGSCVHTYGTLHRSPKQSRMSFLPNAGNLSSCL